MVPISWREQPAFKNLAITTMVIGLAITTIMAVGIALALTGHLPPPIPFHARVFYGVMAGGFVLSVYGLFGLLLVKTKEPRLKKSSTLDLQPLVTVKIGNFPIARPLGSLHDWQPDPKDPLTACLLNDKTIIWMPASLYNFDTKQDDPICFIVNNRSYDSLSNLEKELP